MRRLLRFTPVCAALLLAACEHAENDRWSWDSDPKTVGVAVAPQNTNFEWDRPAVALYSYPTATTPAQATSTTPSIKDLAGPGQAALVAALTKPKSNATTILNDLATQGKTDAADSSTRPATEETSFNRTLVATITKGMSAGPGDRLVWTWIDVEPLNFSFTGYTVIATDNELLTIEQVQNQTTTSLQGQAGETGSNTSATTTTEPPVSNVLTKVMGTSLGASASLSNQYTTSATINEQYVKLSADVLPNELRIYHESERNLDVAGNTLINLKLALDPSTWHSPATLFVVNRVAKVSLYDPKKGAPLAATAIDISYARDELPPKCPLLANVTLLYELRQITRNARSYVEGDQDVAFVRGDYSPVSGPVVLATADEVRRPSWWVYGANDLEHRSPVMLINAYGEVLPMDFASYDMADSFAQWLNESGRWLQTTGATKNVGKAGLAIRGRVDGSFPTGPYYAAPYQDLSMPLQRPAGRSPLTVDEYTQAVADQQKSECSGMVPLLPHGMAHTEQGQKP